MKVTYLVSYLLSLLSQSEQNAVLYTFEECVIVLVCDLSTWKLTFREIKDSGIASFSQIFF